MIRNIVHSVLNDKFILTFKCSNKDPPEITREALNCSLLHDNNKEDFTIIEPLQL